MLSLSHFGRLQDGPGGAQEAPRPPKRTQRDSKRPPRVPQEAPRGPQETPRAGQDDSRSSKIGPRGSKRHRRLIRSPKSTYPKGLAPNRRMKKGGRAAVIPLGEVNPPPPEGSERVQTVFELVFRILRTQRVQPGPAHSAGTEVT